MPNILLLIVVLANIFFMSRYIQYNGLGMFFSTTGIVFLILGIIIFIFFLSIDPGYGWTKSIDLTKNYIMIFTSIAVSLAGIVLIVTGQHMNELHLQSISDSKRCQQLMSGNAEKILLKNWYSLRDQDSKDSLDVYLFQKKSDRNNYKIIAALNETGTAQTVNNLTISSVAIPQPITINMKNSICPGVIEENISIDFDKHQKLNEQVEFDLLITISGNSVDELSRTKQEKTIVFSLKNIPHEDRQKIQTNTQVEMQVQSDRPSTTTGRKNQIETSSLGSVIVFHNTQLSRIDWICFSIASGDSARFL